MIFIDVIGALYHVALNQNQVWSSGFKLRTEPYLQDQLASDITGPPCLYFA